MSVADRRSVAKLLETSHWLGSDGIEEREKVVIKDHDVLRLSPRTAYVTTRLAVADPTIGRRARHVHAEQGSFQRLGNGLAG